MTNLLVKNTKRFIAISLLATLLGIHSYANTTYSVEYGNMMTSFTPEASGQIDIETSVSGINNEIVNNDFSNNTEGWSTPYGSGVVESGNYVQTYSMLHSASRYQYDGITSKVGNKYFAYGNMFTLHPNSTYMRYGNSSYTVAGLKNDWTEVYGNITSENAEPFRLYHRTDTLYAIGDKVSLKPDVVLIDKTKHGIEHLSEDQMLSIARNGITNTTGKNELKILVRGKNLFDIHGEVSKSIHPDYKNPPHNYVVGDKLHAPAGSASHHGRGMFISVKQNTTYTLSYSANENSYIIISDALNGTFQNRLSKRIASRPSPNSGEFSITFESPSSGEIFVSFLKTGSPSATNPAEFWNVQLEEGNTKTSYAPYKSSEVTYQMDVGNDEKSIQLTVWFIHR